MLFIPMIAITLFITGATVAAPKRPGEIVPIWVWIILFNIQFVILFFAGVFAFLVNPETINSSESFKLIASIIAGTGLMLGLLLTWALIRRRRGAANRVDAKGRPTSLNGRMEARRQRVEEAKKTGKL